MIPENTGTPQRADCSSAPCSAEGLLRDAKEHLYDASICNRMGKPAHSVGYLRIAMGKLAMAEKALLGQNDWCSCEKPGPHFHPGSRGKFCAVCGKDIPPNAPYPPTGEIEKEVENKRLRTAIERLEYERTKREPNKADAPGHSHDVRSHWDLDGGLCSWCDAWDQARAALQSLPND